MGREDLVGAFSAGSISRRTFIRCLVATGVSIGAAVGYATALNPVAASAGIVRLEDGSEYYHDYYDYYGCDRDPPHGHNDCDNDFYGIIG
jgi:hypothetical protein